MQFKAILIALTFGAISMAAPAEAEVNTPALSQAALDWCDTLPEHFERRNCREERYEGPGRHECWRYRREGRGER